MNDHVNGKLLEGEQVMAERRLDEAPLLHARGSDMLVEEILRCLGDDGRNLRFSNHVENYTVLYENLKATSRSPDIHSLGDGVFRALGLEDEP